jgi:DNA-binding NarL/FixJ family response regulator
LLEEKLGYECVAEASGGHEAVQKARKFHPDIVIMDIVLPNRCFRLSDIRICEEMVRPLLRLAKYEP